MSEVFLSTFMNFAQEATDAERGLALDLDLNILDRSQVEETLLNKDSFVDLIKTTAQKAIDSDDIIITNNMITDPSKAPTTNVHLHTLRMVVAIPLRGYGVIYLDQRLRQGVFERATIERLLEFGRYLIESDKTDISVNEYEGLFEKS